MFVCLQVCILYVSRVTKEELQVRVWVDEYSFVIQRYLYNEKQNRVEMTFLFNLGSAERMNTGHIPAVLDFQTNLTSKTLSPSCAIRQYPVCTKSSQFIFFVLDEHKLI